MPKKEPKKERGVFERPKDSGVWWTCYFDQYGRKHRECVGMKSAALRVYQQRKTEIRQGKFEPEDIKRKHHNAPVKEIIEDYLRAYESSGRRAVRDTRFRAGYWSQIWPTRSARSILPNDIEQARLELASSRFMSNNREKPTNGRSPATVNRYLAALKAAFSLAVRNGKVEQNPVKLVRLTKENNKRVRFLAEEEEARLLAVVPRKYHPLILLALHTGMRRGETLNLLWEDLDFKRKRITIRQTKAGEARHIPMNDVVRQTLQSLARMLHNPFVFPGEKGSLRKGIENTEWKRYLQEAGIENFRWHDLRHTFATRLVMKGVSLYVVSKLLGHHSLVMTERYAHLAPDFLQNAVDLLSQVTPELTPAASTSALSPLNH
jgi:integrase